MDEAIRIDAESDEYAVTTVVAVPPRKRDFWKVLLGRYEPKVRKRKRLTMKGCNVMLKDRYTPEMSEALYDSPLIDELERRKNRARV